MQIEIVQGQSHIADCWKNSGVSLGHVSSGMGWGHIGNTHMHASPSRGCYYVLCHSKMLGTTVLACSEYIN